MRAAGLRSRTKRPRPVTSDRARPRRRRAEPAMHRGLPFRRTVSLIAASETFKGDDGAGRVTMPTASCRGCRARAHTHGRRCRSR